MFALGHKQTLEHVRVMSALPPKADIAERECHVRFVPKADILRCGRDWRYSITSSAATSIDCGTVIPSALAVLRLMTNSSFTACWTGRSVVLAPCPRDMPAFLNKYSVNGLKILACRLSRSCSRPVPPSTYDVPGEEIVISTTLQSYYVPRIRVGCHSPTPRAMSSKRKYITSEQSVRADVIAKTDGALVM